MSGAATEGVEPDGVEPDGVEPEGAEPDATAGQPAPTRRPRRQRSVTETLCSIALGLEAAVLFFVALVMFGLKLLDPALALGGGLGAIVLVSVVAGLQRYRWGQWLGWAVQLGLILLGLLLPVMFLVGALFAAFWAYCAIRGGQIDRMKAAAASAS
ncbi:DUF4233 domain-containing protein [Homoserinibacter sp. YIM 151385]|uniref:DUF4233 domain-containing protein n=1 Tax=Homoserinibacter sp. YIM 151385 TaxID=2985506 RepID=UPI0022EFFEF5|nr:DUF4233 domain-containing protein [Homoserinibacter sp. YIM 151385]WBU38991.1 DUF4233 domain-containing protein [Homoserinibacter sp. YIM 151385]